MGVEMYNIKIENYADKLISVIYYDGGVNELCERLPVDDSDLIINPFSGELVHSKKIPEEFPSNEEILAKRQESAYSSLCRTKRELSKLIKSFAVLEGVKLIICVTFKDFAVRSDFESVKRITTNYFHNLRRIFKSSAIILIPEITPSSLKRGAIEFHVHGLLYLGKSVEPELFSKWIIKTKKFDKKGRRIYSLRFNHGRTYATMFDGSDNDIEDVLNVCTYAIKYLTKEMQYIAKGRHRYWVSNREAFVAPTVIKTVLESTVDLNEYIQMIADSYGLEVKSEKTNKETAYIPCTYFELM